VFQQIHLLETLSLFDNAMAAGLLVSRDRAAVAARASTLFDQVGIDAATRRKLPAQTSGGEAQRAAVVRALVNSPDVLFADEPTGALDQASGTAVLDVLTSVRDEGQTVVLVTHDLKSARRGDRVLYLRDGQIAGEVDLRTAGQGAGAQDAAIGNAASENAARPGGAGTMGSDEAKAARDTALRSFLIDMGW
jgi:putative ABC transport system ATP-binding protein